MRRGHADAMMRLILILFAVCTYACSSGSLEIATTQPVVVYSSPARPGVEGNHRVGEIPANIILPVKREILGKDFAAYEVEYLPKTGPAVRGYVILGSDGMKVIRRQA